MSIVRDGGTPLDPMLIRRGGYALVVLGVLAGIVAVFVKTPWLAAAEIVLALAASAVAVRAPELFEITGRRASRGINPLFMAPVALVFFGGVANDFVEIAPLLIGAAAGAAIFVAAGLATWRRPGVSGPWQFLILMAVIGAALGYGAPAVIDIRFDGAAPQPYRATVSSMFITHGKSTSYTLRLSPWGPKTQENPVSVASSFYRRVSQGDQVCIALHPGALALPWYEVHLCPISIPSPVLKLE
jgi:hypothetical protein